MQMHNKTWTQLSSRQLFSKPIPKACFSPSSLALLDWWVEWAVRQRPNVLCCMGIREDGGDGHSTCGHTGPIKGRSFHSPTHAAAFPPPGLHQCFSKHREQLFSSCPYSSPSPLSIIVFLFEAFFQMRKLFIFKPINTIPYQYLINNTHIIATWILVPCLSYFRV